MYIIICYDGVRIVKKILLIISSLPLIALIYFFGLGYYSKNIKNNFGIVNDQLRPCPNSPNCVSSQETRNTHYVAPIKTKNVRDTIQTFVNYFSQSSSYRLQQVSNNYLHVVYTSKIFQFKDDLEFYGDPKNNILHIRSASRVGYSDMDANKKRVKKIKSLLTTN